MFALDDDDRVITETATAFAAKRLAPHALEWDATDHFPIDAPGSDPLTARALRRNPAADAAEAFPRDVVELMEYFTGADAKRQVQAVPGTGLHVPIWILGTSAASAATSVPHSSVWVFTGVLGEPLAMKWSAT